MAVSCLVKNVNDEDVNLTKNELAITERKNWKVTLDKLLIKDNKEVAPKSQLYETLCSGHIRVAHRSRDITTRWILDNYVEIAQNAVTTFVTMCATYTQHKTLIS